MLTLFFTEVEVVDWETADTCNREAFARFFNGMLQNGILLPPSQFEAWFISGAHADMHIRKTLEAAEKVFKEM
jgi:glutamate-1-semialdehyde 2,1-aminomutase